MYSPWSRGKKALGGGKPLLQCQLPETLEDLSPGGSHRGLTAHQLLFGKAPASPSQRCDVSIWGLHEPNFVLKREENSVAIFKILSIKGVVTKPPLLQPFHLKKKKKDVFTSKKTLILKTGYI